jgi:hypothetical protein
MAFKSRLPYIRRDSSVRIEPTTPTHTWLLFWSHDHPFILFALLLNYYNP